MDLGKLLAIDVHVHVEKDAKGRYSLDEELRSAAAKYFKGRSRIIRRSRR